MTRFLFLTLAALSCAQPRTSSSAASASSPSHLTPRPGLAVYDGDVTIDPRTGTLDARWRITFDQRSGDTVRLRLNRGFRVAGQSTTTDGD